MQRERPDPVTAVHNVRSAQSRNPELSFVDSNSPSRDSDLAIQAEHPMGCTCPGCLAYAQSKLHADPTSVAAAAHDVAGPASPPPSTALATGSAGHSAMSGPGAFGSAPPASAFAVMDTVHGLATPASPGGTLIPHLGDHLLII